MDLGMAVPADSSLDILFVVDLQWHMRRMALGGASREILSFIVGFVARVAFGQKAVRSVALPARQPGMGAGKFLQLVKLPAVTDDTGVDQYFCLGNFGGSMGVAMATRAVREFFTVGKYVAVLASGHQFLPVFLNRTISV